MSASRIVCAAFGSRGDVEPHIALASEIARRGYDHVVAATDDFARLAADAGVEFVGAGVSVGNDSWLNLPFFRGLSATGSVATAALLASLMRQVAPGLAAALARVVRPGDTVVAGLLAMPTALVIGRARGARVIELSLTPTTPTRYGESYPVPIRSRPSTINLGWSRTAARLGWRLGMSGAQAMAREIGVTCPTTQQVAQAAEQADVILAVSEQLWPHPPDAGSRVYRTGPLQRPWIGARPVDQRIESFLAAGPAPVYVGFGSAPTSDPRREADRIERAAKEADVRIVHRPFEYAGVPLPQTTHTLRVAQVDHEWLLPRCAAVVHHGGAGTTHAALRAGVPSVSIPHFLDQFAYARAINALGVGPISVSRRALAHARLVELLRQLARGSAAQGYRQRAARVAARERALAERRGGVRRAVDVICS